MSMIGKSIAYYETTSYFGKSGISGVCQDTEQKPKRKASMKMAPKRRKAARRLFTLCLLIGAGASIPSETRAAGDDRANDPEIKIEAALYHAQENRKIAERLVKQILEDIELTNKILGSIGTVSSAKGSSKTMIALPDVCKTPSPAGPVPIPYPNIARSSDTSKGSKSVKVDGKMVMIKGEEYYKNASGDEAGTQALVEHLRSVRSEVEIRHDFVAGVYREYRLVKADKKTLQEWLKSTKKHLQRQLGLFDDHIKHIKQAQRDYSKYVKS